MVIPQAAEDNPALFSKNVSKYGRQILPLVTVSSIISELLLSTVSLADERSYIQLTQAALPVEKEQRENDVIIISDDGVVESERREAIKSAAALLNFVYGDIFGFDLSESFLIKIHLFARYEDYREYQLNTYKKIISNYAFYNSPTGEVMFWKDHDKSMFLQGVVHEMSHRFLHEQVNNFPGWLDEGLASFFEGLTFKDNQAVFSLSREADAFCRHKAKYETDFDITSYFNMSSVEWDNTIKSKGFVTYYIPCSVVYFLMSTDNRRQVLKEILHYLRQDDNSWQASITAFNLYYPGGINQFARDWKLWVQQKHEPITLPFRKKGSPNNGGDKKRYR